MKPLLHATLLGTAALLMPPATAPAPSAAPSQPEAPSCIVEQDPAWVEPPGESSCLFVIEPLTGTARELSVGPSFLPHIDVKPGKCPNVLHVDDDDDDDDDCSFQIASLTVGVIGNDFDVTQIDIGTLRMSRLGEQLAASSWPLLAPFHWSYRDVATPFEGTPCGCNNLGPDGVQDLKLKFARNEVIDAFELDQEPDGVDVVLRISARSPGGLGFRVYDCVHIDSD